MACSLFVGVLSKPIHISVRHGHHLRGKPPGIARTIVQKLADMNRKDESLCYRVDIGLPPPEASKMEQTKRLEVLRTNRKDAKLERLSRNRELKIDLKGVEAEHLKTVGPHHIKTIADHYGVFEHLFGDAYFYPRVPLMIKFRTEDVYMPVYYGNSIKPHEADNKPEVMFHSDDKSLWTLILTNPDGHLTESNAEYLHWFVGNIPGNKIEKGETVMEYLRPFPPKGTGYHRHIFVLFKQEKKLDYSKLAKSAPCLNLAERTFKMLDFYKERQDVLTPASLAFFQADWDETVHDFYHKSLQMKEPIFEYDFPPPYIRPQVWFPLRQPFNLYLDKYRDPKQINKEFLMRKLEKVHPFKPTPKPLPYPNAMYFEGYQPSWLRLEKTKSRLGWGRINDIK